MSGRRMLTEALSAALPSWQVLSHPMQLDAVRQPAAAVLWTQKRSRAPQMDLTWFQDEITLWILTATDKPSLIEDDLDDLLVQVMTALAAHSAFYWDTAERDVLADTFHGYRLTVQCVWQLEPEE